MVTASAEYPARYESRLTLKDGREVFVRPIKPTDEQLIVDLFNRLSTGAIYLRFLRQLSALPRDMLYRFTHLDYEGEFALAAIMSEDDMEAIVAVARYALTPPDDLADLAVAVRDDWQHLGLGKSILKKVVEIGKEHGIRRYGGLMDPRNVIIRQILLELGYDVKYSLKNGIFEVDIRA